MTRALLLLPLVAALLSGCAQTIERACGLEGEGCCDGSCGDGLACVDERCERCTTGGCGGCGALGDACCTDGEACEAGLRCAAASCVELCGAGCVPDVRDCGPDGVPRLCSLLTEGSVCTRWVALGECPAEQLCRAGDCTDACETDCRPDEARCGAEGPMGCRLDEATGCPEWVALPLPPELNTCLAGACTDLFCWENPLPAANEIRAYFVDPSGAELVLDLGGNVLAQFGGAWNYDYRVRDAQTPRLLAVSVCPMVSNAYAITETGLLRRGSDGWVPVPIRQLRGELSGVSCRTSGEFVVASTGGDLLVVEDEDEYLLDLAELPPLEHLAWDPLGEAIYAGGPDVGGVLRCAVARSPLSLSCRLDVPAGFEVTGGVEVLLADPFGVVYVATSAGDLWVRREGAWALVPGAFPGLSSLASRDGGGAWLGSTDGWVWELPAGAILKNVRQLSTTELVGLGESEGRLRVADADFELSSLDLGEPRSTPEVHSGAVTRASLAAIAGRDERDLYAVGEQGVILHRHGELWQREGVGVTNTDLLAVAVASSDEVYAFGVEGTILARRGGVWRQEGVGLTTEPLAAAWSDGHFVYAGGGHGVLLERPVGPSPDEWTIAREPADGQGYLSSIAGRAPIEGRPSDEVIVVDGGCTLLRRTSIGLLAEEVPQCDEGATLAAWDGRGDLWLAGGFFPTELHRRSNDVWSASTLDVDGPEALFSTGDTMWLTALGGSVRVHQSEQWYRQLEGVQVPSAAGLATSDGDIFLVGRGGAIWHRR